MSHDERTAVLDRMAGEADLVARFGITREEVLEAASRRLVGEIRAEGLPLSNRLTIPLKQAADFSGLTRDELKRRAVHIDHGNRNQRITLAAYDELLESKTKHPKK